MSRICYLVISSMEKDPKTLRGSLEQYLDRKGYAAFFLYEYPEPVLERYRKLHYVFDTGCGGIRPRARFSGKKGSFEPSS